MLAISIAQQVVPEAKEEVSAASTIRLVVPDTKTGSGVDTEIEAKEKVSTASVTQPVLLPAKTEAKQEAPLLTTTQTLAETRTQVPSPSTVQQLLSGAKTGAQEKVSAASATQPVLLPAKTEAKEAVPHPLAVLPENKIELPKEVTIPVVKQPIPTELKKEVRIDPNSLRHQAEPKKSNQFEPNPGMRQMHRPSFALPVLSEPRRPYSTPPLEVDVKILDRSGHSDEDDLSIYREPYRRPYKKYDKRIELPKLANSYRFQEQERFDKMREDVRPPPKREEKMKASDIIKKIDKLKQEALLLEASSSQGKLKSESLPPIRHEQAKLEKEKGVKNEQQEKEETKEEKQEEKKEEHQEDKKEEHQEDKKEEPEEDKKEEHQEEEKTEPQEDKKEEPQTEKEEEKEEHPEDKVEEKQPEEKKPEQKKDKVKKQTKNQKCNCCVVS